MFRFFYNKGINVCADMNWVVDYIYMSGEAESREEAEENLLLKREYCGWYECEVSNTIEDLFNLYMG